ncbi:Ku protein [Starkeya sp. ORNL1]|uniref:non-homologous end joining protein Ku n=1 Tax=Starkeya sp. ORNL1 TaxID=2709380 RepID=UPI001463F12F|nr:Ku protein [Starkeya sp. ORNL1]QJP12765.1 Ku protein [Starkeya sp. ORNL1]
MAPRANWKGYLKIAELTCPVALFTAASTSDRIAFHTINRATGHRVHRQFVDVDTGKPVEKDDQVKGYEVGRGDYVMLEPEEVASVVPESDKKLDVSAFIPFAEIDDVYFDKPYYLAPSDKTATEAFILIREGMRKKKVAAIAQAVLFRRVRTLLIRADGDGLIANTLNFDYEVRSAKEAFDGVPEMKTKDEMLDLARHIIETKKGSFDPSAYEDRYEAALAELVKAKLEGRKIEVRKAPRREKVVDLMAALRESAGLGGKKTATKTAASKSAKPAVSKSAKPAAPRRKAS